MRAFLLTIITGIWSLSAMAQNCPLVPTFRNLDGTFDFTLPGLSYVVDNGSSRSVTISKDLSPTSTICVRNGSTLSLSFALSGTSDIRPGAVIFIEAGSKLEIKGNSISKFPFTLINNGSFKQDVAIQLRDGASITNNGVFEVGKALSLNEGYVTLLNNGTMVFSDVFSFTAGALSFKNMDNGTMQFKSSMQINNADMVNKGTIRWDKTPVLKTSSLYNTNTITINGGSSDVFQITSDTIINYGHITSQVAMQVNSAGLLKNFCRIFLYKDFQNNSVTTNEGAILLEANNSSAIFRNNGVFVNGEMAYVQGYDFYNTGGSITGGGEFYFKNSTTNNASFDGTSALKINFYDATPSTGSNKYFDNQSTNPSFTTKNVIAPLSLSTTEEPCGEPAPPVITVQPARVINCDVTNGKATFSVSAKSPFTAISYQWLKNGVNINNATQSSFSETGLKLEDTANVYTVALTNKYGTSYSNGVGVKFVIVGQPAPQYVATGSAASLTVQASTVATSFLWHRNGSKIDPAIFATFSKSPVALSDSGNYTVRVGYNGGFCWSNPAKLTVENLPTITAQPQTRLLCDTATTSATFSVTAALSQTPLSYQWYKNGTAINGATKSSYTATNLKLADTANTYYAILTNGIGTTTTRTVGIKYIIVQQPANVYSIVGTPAILTVSASSVATGYQWYKNGSKIDPAVLPTYTRTLVAQADSGSYIVVVSYAGGTCTSKPAILTVDAPPTVVAQPQLVRLCNTNTTSASFSVVATSPYSTLKYQWLKNGVAINGATASSYTTALTGYADTAALYSVRLTNNAGTTTSNSAGVKYIIVSQPGNATVVTGNPATFSIQVSGATAVQWYKSGVGIYNATTQSYSLPVVNVTDSASYTAVVTYNGGTCLSNVAKLTPATTVYSKAAGSFDSPATWGASLDGTGSTPLDFARSEHTFVIANRGAMTNNSNLTIAGTLDVKDGTLQLAPGTTLTAGAIKRTGTGMIAADPTASIVLTGIPYNAAVSSDLFFDKNNNTLLMLNTAAQTVNLRNALNLTAGSDPGRLVVQSGILNTFDSLTLKSDSLGTAFVYVSPGEIRGKVTVERFMPSRRSWRLMSAPVAATDAPTINAAWQEGAKSSTDNPKPGYGTHITYGAEADGYDQNPQKTFSMYYLNGSRWSGVPPTNQTKVTDYPAYLFFVRGDRSYNITNTTSSTAPSATILRTTGLLNQGTQPGITVDSVGYTLVGNPYASPIDWDLVVRNPASKFMKKTIRVWDPSLAGSKGVGSYVTVDWDGTTYTTTPPSKIRNMVSASQGFFVQSMPGKIGTVVFDESAKQVFNSKNPFGRETTPAVNTDGKLEINLKVINDDGTTGINDGVLYRFNNSFSNDVDGEDVEKFSNMYENLSIHALGKLLTIERRQMPVEADTLQLYLTGAKLPTYQLEIVPIAVNADMYLYDAYLRVITPVSTTDTTVLTINFNSADIASKLPTRFCIIMQKRATVLPLTFVAAKAYAKNKTAQVEWTVAGEVEVARYEVEKSANGTLFSKAGEVKASGAAAYSFNDAAPYSGTGYYRVKSVDKNGKEVYTKVMPVTINMATTAALSIYPNPLKGKSFDIQLSGKSAGTYTLTLVSQDGKQLYSKTIAYNGGTQVFHVQLSSALASGVYFINATGTGTKETIKAIVQ